MQSTPFFWQKLKILFVDCHTFGSMSLVKIGNTSSFFFMINFHTFLPFVLTLGISLIWLFSAFHLPSTIFQFFGCQLFLQATYENLHSCFWLPMYKLPRLQKDWFYPFHNLKVFSTPISAPRVIKTLLKVHNLVGDALKTVSGSPMHWRTDLI